MEPAGPALFVCGLVAGRKTKHTFAISDLEDTPIKPVTQLHLNLKQRPWPFAEQNRSRIDAYWSELGAVNPDIWNGNALMAYDVNLSGSVFSASFLKTDYASFIAWRDWGWPDTTVYNCFGSAVIQSSDGALIYGCMGSNTLNAGLCYPPGGSLDHTDLRDDGSIDLEGSIIRELAEETGLDAASAITGGLWAIFDQQRISIARMLTFGSSADAIADQINAHILADESPELSGAVVLRAISDTNQPMVGFARHLARHVLAD